MFFSLATVMTANGLPATPQGCKEVLLDELDKSISLKRYKQLVMDLTRARLLPVELTIKAITRPNDPDLRDLVVRQYKEALAAGQIFPGIAEFSLICNAADFHCRLIDCNGI